MHFSKQISKDNRTALKLMLKLYEAETPMTSIERKFLRKWVYSGNTPYSNPKGYITRDGKPMDFIAGIHYEFRLIKEYDAMSAREREYYRKISRKKGYMPWDDVEFYSDIDLDDKQIVFEELPF